jgi:hypothetical protein
MSDVFEGTAEEIHIPVEPEPFIPAPASTAVVRRERRSEVIKPLAVSDVVESMELYQQMLPRLLTESDYQDAGRGKRFVKKSGWRKIATAFDLDVQILRSIVERDDNGQPLRAEVWARAIAPSGRSMDGDGYCAIDEERFSGPRGNKSKVENDLRGTATTRAKNRAISDLVGMGDVSAEEVDSSPEVGPSFGPKYDGPGYEVGNAIAALATAEAVKPVVDEILKTAGGYMPKLVADTLIALANAAGHVTAPEVS